MAGQMTEWFSKELLAAKFTPDTHAPDYNQLKIALTLTTPPVDIDPGQIVEPSGGGYARASVPLTSAGWTVSPYREVYNTNEVVFPEATAIWGWVVGYVVVTANSTIGPGYTGTKTVGTGQLVTPYLVNVADQPRFPAGTFVFGIYA